jgi:uncharacterized PurR-regulated membrane protein YhhQ (DUF165 family)
MPNNHHFKYITSAAIILYPLRFIIDDIFTEVYRYVRIRPIIWLAFANSLWGKYRELYWRRLLPCRPDNL